MQAISRAEQNRLSAALRASSGRHASPFWVMFIAGPAWWIMSVHAFADIAHHRKKRTVLSVFCSHLSIPLPTSRLTVAIFVIFSQQTLNSQTCRAAGAITLAPIPRACGRHQGSVRRTVEKDSGLLD